LVHHKNKEDSNRFFYRKKVFLIIFWKYWTQLLSIGHWTTLRGLTFIFYAQITCLSVNSCCNFLISDTNHSSWEFTIS